MTYLVTGATGGLGGGILEYLSEKVPVSEIAVLVRSQEKGKVFADKGYDVRVADFSDQEKLEQAFEGIDTLMFVSSAPGQEISREQQHRNVIAAAKAAGVKNIVYTSISNGEKSTSVLAPDHIVTESLIKNSGLAYKILRNNWYLENEVDTIKSALAGKGFVHAGGDGKVGWALRREYAEAAANVLAGDFSTSNIYELAGRQISYAELAAAVKEATGQDFEVVSLSDQDFRQGLKEAGLPEPVIAIVAGIQSSIADHQLEVAHSQLENLLGHQQLPLVEAIKEVLV